ncbi:putative ATP-grasp-modified RiPP [Streptomyces sp. NPDC054765]
MPLAAERTTTPAPAGPASISVRPFGLTKAVPVTVSDIPQGLPVLTLCPDRQISVTENGTPFIHKPSMATALTTVQETREDHQPDTSTENDSD